MKLPTELEKLVNTTDWEIEAIVRHCAKVCAEMYKTPPENFRWDLAQGWETALDLAEQRILKEFDLEP